MNTNENKPWRYINQHRHKTNTENESVTTVM